MHRTKDVYIQTPQISLVSSTCPCNHHQDTYHHAIKKSPLKWVATCHHHHLFAHMHISPPNPPRPFRCFPLDLFSGSTKFTRIWNLGTKIGKSRETLEPGNSSSVRWENKQRDQLMSIIFRVDVWMGINILKDLNIAWCIWWCLHSLHRMTIYDTARQIPWSTCTTF